MRQFIYTVTCISLGLVSCSRWQPLSHLHTSSFLIQAHAHNDYQHEKPLLDALDHGFGSIEADIHLANDQLYVAHDPEDIQPEKTLQSLYLDPLRTRIKNNQSMVYGKKIPLLLFIDIKTHADSTYDVLSNVLSTYRDILTLCHDGRQKKRAVTVILSGNRPREALRSEQWRYAGYDGRPEDLAGNEKSSLMPIISDKWSNHFSWYGEGPIPQREKAKLDSMVQKAHDQGRWLRFWATDVRPPSVQQNLWAELLRAGVDLINTDKLADLKTFLGHSSSIERTPSGKP